MAGMATNLARPGLPSGQACREVGVGKNRGEQSAEGVGHNAEAAAPAKEEVGNEADAAEFATEGGGLEKNRGSEPEAEDAGYEAEAVEPAKKKGGLDISCGERGALDISHGAQGAELATQKVGFDEIHSEMARRRSASRRRGPRRRRGRKSAWAWHGPRRAGHGTQRKEGVELLELAAACVLGGGRIRGRMTARIRLAPRATTCRSWRSWLRPLAAA